MLLFFSTIASRVLSIIAILNISLLEAFKVVKN